MFVNGTTSPIILANSLYLFGYTLWQDLTGARSILLQGYQWNLLAHFGVGILFVVLSMAYGLSHLREVLRRRKPVTLVGGILAFLACIALLETATASAPSAIALRKSLSIRSPPVAISETPVALRRSRWRRARGNAAIVGTEMLFLKISGAAPVPPPRPSRVR